MRILISGADGQLGKAFQEHFIDNKIDFVPTDVRNLDITSLEQLRAKTKNENFTHIINCAAYNDVDKAQSDWKKAFLINAIGTKNLTIVANEIGAQLVHFSTDYVFDGKSKRPYTIYDNPNPLSKYARSKLAGELLVKELSTRFYIFRVSWLFGDGNTNFIKKLLGWAKNKKKLSIVTDEVSSPTYAIDVVKASIQILQKKAYGTYHITNEGYCSRKEWAQYILKLVGWNGKIISAKQKDFKLPAKRPKFSALDNFGLKETIGETLPHWKDATKRYLKKYL